MEDPAMELFAGTSGYSYKEWKGPFYPEQLPAKEMLGYYAERLPSVEINNTFYRLPRESVLETWATQVPEHFRFAIKASRRITHFKRLADAGDETGYLLRTTETLGDRLGVLLFQLPPNLKLDLERLQGFVKLLPAGTRAAFEFRHESWQDEAVHRVLRDGNFALCVADTEDGDAPPVLSTADWGYLRLRRPAYDRAELAGWAERMRAAEWSDAFVYFKHEDDGAGPRMAREFLDVAERVLSRKPPVAPRRAMLVLEEQLSGERR
jgi:uncharacterized protein YecE (DUF72 family)